MPLYVAGSGFASWGAKYHHRLGQPPIRTTLFGSLASAACSSSMFARKPSVLRREQQQDGTTTARPSKFVLGYAACCVTLPMSKLFLMSDLPHLNCCHWLWLREDRAQSLWLGSVSREARSPKAVIPQPNNSASNAQRDSPGSAAASLQRAHFRQRRFSVQSTLLCLNNSCLLRSATSQPPAVANTDRPTKHLVKPRTGAASRASTFEVQRAHQRPFRSIQPEQSPRMPRTLACHSPAH